MKELLLIAGVFGLAVVSAFVPLVSIELVLVGAAATRSAESVLVAQVLAAAVGQMVGKSCFFLGGRAATRKKLRLSPKAQAVQRFVARIAGQRAAPVLTVLVSAVTGLPPFALVSALAGTWRLRLSSFFVLGLAGRSARFAGVLLVPQLPLL